MVFLNVVHVFVPACRLALGSRVIDRVQCHHAQTLHTIKYARGLGAIGCGDALQQVLQKLILPLLHTSPRPLCVCVSHGMCEISTCIVTGAWVGHVGRNNSFTAVYSVCSRRKRGLGVLARGPPLQHLCNKAAAQPLRGPVVFPPATGPSAALPRIATQGDVMRFYEFVF